MRLAQETNNLGRSETSTYTPTRWCARQNHIYRYILVPSGLNLWYLTSYQGYAEVICIITWLEELEVDQSKNLLLWVMRVLEKS